MVNQKDMDHVLVKGRSLEAIPKSQPHPSLQDLHTHDINLLLSNMPNSESPFISRSMKELQRQSNLLRVICGLAEDPGCRYASVSAQT
jgi:hypothetical protein